MKKNIIRLLLIALLVVTMLVGCSGESEEESSEATANSGETTNSDEKEYKVAMILNSTISDGGWGTACYNAMVDAAETYGFQTQYTDGLATADYASSIRSYCDLGFDMIFAPGNEYTDAVVEVAADYPDVKFVLLNGSVEEDNIVSILPDAEQIGYLAGTLAGLMTSTNSIGFIGGIELDTTVIKLECFEEGAKAVNPDITVYSAYAGSFSDSAKGKEIADSMVTLNDVDVIYGDASAVDSGAREALANYEDRYNIGQPSDLLATQESDVILTSIVADNAKMLELCMEDLINDNFGNKTIYGNLENGSLSVGTFSDNVSEELKEQYFEIVEEINQGTLIQ